ncbi:uncharacterized protein SCHCODRAFT_02697772 [Schizophyllum commune H4-8]|uniref:uncharacterized protein n=1 Tax=Schizophyllum commune (strain H4-8 / FGSC 9210) TaxID=578458 RepID=UPI002160469D|nr:uncharacterized protein SCHCODRAFT_02697772 [Schizophyllum commune H4-8]KAI5896328.1 hypothetical protein SCHCODRAFT_02697772 [Schizophyllum commune H4-8]
MSNADSLLPPDLRSLKGRVRKYAMRKELSITDIVTLTKPVFDTIRCMQLVLNSLATYIPERTHTYQIDPKESFSKILLHAASLEELQLAWVGLTGRLMGAQQVYDKYFAEALREQGARNVDAFSQPATTPSTVYRHIEEEEDPHCRLRLALGGLPNSCPIGTEPDQDRNLTQYLDANVRRMIRVPTPIEDAFPPRDPEDNPHLLYYDDLNRRRLLPPKTTYQNPLGYSPIEPPKSEMEGRRSNPPPSPPPPPPPVPLRPPRSTRSSSSRTSTSSSSTSTSARPGSSHPSSSSSSSLSSRDGDHRERRRSRKPRRSTFQEMHLQPIDEEDPPPSDPDNDPSDRGGRRSKRHKKKSGKGDHNKDGDGGPPADDENPGSRAARTPVPGINPIIKPESLPLWDGNRATVMNYFWHIVELAQQGGCMPQALGEWLWSQLVPNSLIQRWYMTQSEERKEFMRQGHKNFIATIKKHYLGPAWISALSSEFPPGISPATPPGSARCGRQPPELTVRDFPSIASASRRARGQLMRPPALSQRAAQPCERARRRRSSSFLGLIVAE